MAIAYVVICDRCDRPHGGGDVLWHSETDAIFAVSSDGLWRRTDDDEWICYDCSIEVADNDDNLTRVPSDPTGRADKCPSCRSVHVDPAEWGRLVRATLRRYEGDYTGAKRAAHELMVRLLSALGYDEGLDAIWEIELWEVDDDDGDDDDSDA